MLFRDEFRNAPPISPDRVLPFTGSGSPGGDGESVQRILASVLTISYKTGDIIYYQFCVTHQRKSSRGGITKKLVTQAAFNTRNYLYILQ